jgi:hypothetical protein
MSEIKVPRTRRIGRFSVQKTPVDQVARPSGGRRRFATQNAAGMDLLQLQGLMTTKLYVNMPNRLTKAVKGLYVPDVSKRVSARQSRTASM